MADDPPLVFDWELDCSEHPGAQRAFHPQTFDWQGQEYLMFSKGNWLSLQDLADPQDPNEISVGYFAVGNLGDSDYDLLSYAICDDCRYGMAVFKMATVFFDLGVGSVPDFSDYVKSTEIGEIPHGMTFKRGPNQYLIAAGLNNYECGPEGSGLYQFNSIQPSQITLLQCLEDDHAQPLLITGGKMLQDDDLNNGTPFIWGSTGYHFHILKVTGFGAQLRLQFVRTVGQTPVVARGTPILGFDVNLDAGAFPNSNDGLAVTVHPTAGLKVWRVANLGNPQVVGTYGADDGNSIASLAYPIVWVGMYNATGYEATYDLSSPSSPQLLHDDFWRGGANSQPWNDWLCSTIQTGSTFTKDGRFLFAGRYEVLQRFDFTGCGSP